MPSIKNIAILGSTGSIGTQALDIVGRLPDKLRVVALAANNNGELLASQATTHGVSDVSIGEDEAAIQRLRSHLVGRNIRLHVGVEGMCALATLDQVDLVVVAVAGAVGIAPTHAALEAGKDVALASKEVLVAAGEHTMALARRTGARVLPIDSEHSALFQCLECVRELPGRSVEKLYLTASGGPFRTLPKERMAHVTPAEALKHPTWNMGGLVTINSATLMNKGLEIIEARWLFDVPVGDVDVVVHPQSIVHSLVRLNDGSVLAQLGLPDMRLPIQYALVYPERLNTELPRLDVSECGPLTFEPPDEERFPALKLARRAAEAGATLPAVMNAANEVAVEQFLGGKRPFTGIMEAVERAMDVHERYIAGNYGEGAAGHTGGSPAYQEILRADTWAREFTRKS